jgi:hypothetical protein
MGGLLGLYVTNNAKPESLEKRSRAFGVPVEKDTVWGVGNTTPTTWAHEYRHRGGVLDEASNRLLDAFNAQSPAQWREAVEMYRQYRGFESPDEAERDLVETLKKNTALFGFKGISPDPQRFSSSVAKGLDQTSNAWDSTRKRAYEAATKFPWMLWANKRGLLAE